MLNNIQYGLELIVETIHMRIDPIGYGLSKFDKLYHARQVMTDLLSTGKLS